MKKIKEFFIEMFADTKRWMFIPLACCLPKFTIWSLEGKTERARVLRFIVVIINFYITVLIMIIVMGLFYLLTHI